MNKRAMTIAEIQAMLEELAGKVTADGAALFSSIKVEVEELKDAAEERVEELKADLIPKLEDLKSKVTTEGQEIIDKIEERIDIVQAEIQEEIEEFQEKGALQWAKDNPHIVGIVAITVSVIILAIVL